MAGLPPPPGLIERHNERTAITAQQLLAANRDNPAWQAGGFSLAEQIRDADDREIIMLLASLFADDDDGGPGFGLSDMLDFEQMLIRSCRAWAVGRLVAESEAAA